MVRGRGIAVIARDGTYQCAEMARIARGRGAAAPNARQASVKRLRSSAFIGLPWPRKAAGIRGEEAIGIVRAGPAGTLRPVAGPRADPGATNRSRPSAPASA